MQWTAEVATENKAEATHNFIMPRIRANHLSERAYPYARYPIGSDSRLDKLVREIVYSFCRCHWDTSETIVAEKSDLSLVAVSGDSLLKAATAFVLAYSLSLLDPVLFTSCLNSEFHPIVSDLQLLWFIRYPGTIRECGVKPGSIA